MLSLNHLRLLILLLVPLVSLGIGCSTDGDDDDSAAADDDTVTGDDDDDDDTSGDDDDTTVTGPIECDGSLPIFDESESNDAIEGINLIAPLGAEGFCVQGAMTCGERAYLDRDLFLFQLPETRELQVLLTWAGSADMDSYLWDVAQWNPEPAQDAPSILTFEESMSSPEDQTATGVADLPIVLEVDCWNGTDGDYTVEIRYAPIVVGDDDDSAGDDDDSALPGDDDDSAMLGDDDDSALPGDDDDSALPGDDDDSALPGDDDDSALPGDDDDSAMLGDDDDSATL